MAWDDVPAMPVMGSAEAVVTNATLTQAIVNDVDIRFFTCLSTLIASRISP